jgi:hypothetical protein
MQGNESKCGFDVVHDRRIRAFAHMSRRLAHMPGGLVHMSGGLAHMSGGFVHVYKASDFMLRLMVDMNLTV